MLMVERFEALDYDGQIKRLTDAARGVLTAYGLAGAAMQPVLYVNNATFRVEAAGRRYALRLGIPGHKPAAWIESELAWLRAIHRETGLGVPVPVETQDGALLTTARVEGLREPVTCALFGWIDGQPVQRENFSVELARQAGAFLGRLHRFASRFEPPDGFARPTLDWEGLFGEESPYNPGAGAAIFTAEQRDVFAQVDRQVGQVMDRLGRGRETFGLIHADFILKNMLIGKGDLFAIDFDNCGWGYYLYDLAPLLLQVKDQPDYPVLHAAYLEGYSGARPLPETAQTDVETFIAARHLASCRWIAGNLHHPHIRERAADIVAGRTAELRRFLYTGTISQQGEHF